MRWVAKAWRRTCGDSALPGTARAHAERGGGIGRREQGLDVGLRKILREPRHALGRIQFQRRVGLDPALAQAPAVEALQAGKHARGARGPAFSCGKETEEILFA